MKLKVRNHLLDRVDYFYASMADVESDHPPEGTQRRPRRTTRMTTKRKAAVEDKDKDNKKRRTFGDFFMFCNFVLEYEEKLATAECYSRGAIAGTPGMNSAGESSVSTSPTSSESSSLGSEGSDDGGRDNEASSGTDSSSSEDDSSTNEKLEYTSDDDSWNLVTCFCRRPFAGRPMIECSKCQTWVHLYCAKIKKEEVPDTYFCPKCSNARSRS